MNYHSHPISRLRTCLLKEHPDIVLEFSKYIHQGYGKTYSRDIFVIRAKSISDDWLDEQICSLNKGQELALHSRVLYRNREFHIPMIDFINTDSPEKVQPCLINVSKNLPVDIWFYRSGKSLHGYYFCLIDKEHWYRYLGSILLCNQSFKRDIVDQRWVGHSLEHQFSALRWSHNTVIYKSMPEVVELKTANY